jgi:hypothetical protein
MSEILLFGLVVVGVYFIAHVSVMKIEAHHGKPLGGWRTAWFFAIFLALILIAIALMEWVLG